MEAYQRWQEVPARRQKLFAWERKQAQYSHHLLSSNALHFLTILHPRNIFLFLESKTWSHEYSPVILLLPSPNFSMPAGHQGYFPSFLKRSCGHHLSLPPELKVHRAGQSGSKQPHPLTATCLQWAAVAGRVVGLRDRTNAFAASKLLPTCGAVVKF